MMEPQDKYREVESALEKFWGEEDLLVGKGKSTPAQIALRFRNAMVLLAAILFLLSFASNRYPILRAVGYLFGAIAYICEIMVLTDCFKVKIRTTSCSCPTASARSTSLWAWAIWWAETIADKKHRRRSVLFFYSSADLADGRLVVLPPRSRSSRRGRGACR